MCLFHVLSLTHKFNHCMFSGTSNPDAIIMGDISDMIIHNLLGFWSNLRQCYSNLSAGKGFLVHFIIGGLGFTSSELICVAELDTKMTSSEDWVKYNVSRLSCPVCLSVCKK